MRSSSAKTASVVQSAWLQDARFDLVFVVGIALLAAVMSAVTVVSPELFLAMLTVHTWLFGYEHLAATYTRLFGRPEDRERFFRLTFWVPPLVLLALCAVSRTSGLIGIYVVYFFGQLHHTVRQSFGIAQQYRQRAGGLPWDPRWQSQLTLWSVPIWGLLHRCVQRPVEFLFQPFWLPPVPRALETCAAIASAGLWLYWFYTRVAAYRRGELALGHTLYMLSHLYVYLGGYILIDDLCSGWLLVNVWHNVQYIVFVWHFNRRRFASGIDPQSRVLSWLSQPGWVRTALYGLSSVLFALPLYYLLPRLGLTLDKLVAQTAVPSAILIGLSLTFHHYIVDAFVWKRRNDPTAI